MRRMYSEKQLENIVDEHLEVSDVKVKTIEQSEPNASIDISSLLNSSFFKDTSSVYAKLEVYGNVLYLVVAGKFTTKTESTTYHSILNQTDISDLGNEILSKIYRAEGSTLNNAPIDSSGFNTIISEFNYVYNHPSLGQNYAALSSTQKDKVNLIVYGMGTTTEDDSCYIDIRTFLVL